MTQALVSASSCVLYLLPNKDLFSSYLACVNRQFDNSEPTPEEMYFVVSMKHLVSSHTWRSSTLSAL
jgi:hypothetical protein